VIGAIVLALGAFFHGIGGKAAKVEQTLIKEEAQAVRTAQKSGSVITHSATEDAQAAARGAPPVAATAAPKYAAPGGLQLLLSRSTVLTDHVAALKGRVPSQVYFRVYQVWSRHQEAVRTASQQPTPTNLATAELTEAELIREVEAAEAEIG
jgi:hypothetical protein